MVSHSSLPRRCSPAQAEVDGEGDPRGPRCRGDELPAERARALGTGAAQPVCRVLPRAEGKQLLLLKDFLMSAFRATGIFCHLPVSVPLCKEAFPVAKHPSLLLPQAPTPLTASLTERPTNRLPPEDGAHIPRNRRQALHSTVHFGAAPRTNPAILYQKH